MPMSKKKERKESTRVRIDGKGRRKKVNGSTKVRIDELGKGKEEESGKEGMSPRRSCSGVRWGVYQFFVM